MLISKGLKIGLKGCFVILALIMIKPADAGPRFTDNGNGTVTDHQLGVMWAKTDNQGDIAWKEAAAWTRYTFGLTVTPAYDNWRLPTLEELKTLFAIDASYPGYQTDCGIRVKIVPQIRVSCVLVWSSDSALGSHLAFNFNLGDAFAVPAYDIGGCRALPVRSLK